MDGSTFDAWTRRRFGLGLGGLLAGALGRHAGPGAAARKKPKKRSCTKKQKQKCRRQDRGCEEGKCVVPCTARNSACRSDVVQICGKTQDLCLCTALKGGGFACAERRPDECPEFSECIGDRDCGQDEVCADLAGDLCCGESKGLCLKECKGGISGN